MSSFRHGVVTELCSQRRGLQRITVDLGAGPEPAFVLRDLTGDCGVGDRVVVNTTAVDLDLGTGGAHVVHWNLAAGDLALGGSGHVLKLRYTSLQAEAGTSELEHPECDLPLGGAPVVACTLHSQLLPVVRGVHSVSPKLRVAYLQTDGAALPLALSESVAGLSDRGEIVGSVTCGSAFGGDLEAVGVASGLGLAVHTLGADVVVAAVGPGVAGTGTALGTSALDAVSVVDLTDSLAGTPVLCVRTSTADPRDRHRGVSHHTRTVARLTHATPLVADPGGLEVFEGVEFVDLGAEGRAASDRATLDPSHRVMGRSSTEDPSPFRAAVAAGVLAAQRASSPPMDPSR